MSGRGGGGRSGARIPRAVLALAKEVAEGAAGAPRSVNAVKNTVAVSVKPAPRPTPATGAKAKIVSGLRKLHPMD